MSALHVPDLRRHPTAPPLAPPMSRSRPETAGWRELVFVPIAGAVGFALTSVLTWWLEIPRAWMVAIYAPAVFALFVAYLLVNRVDLVAALRHQWRWGVVAGCVFGAALIFTVQRQDASARPEGWRLIFDLAWLGVVYGAADAILMNILPVMAVWRVASRRGWTENLMGRVEVGALAVVASVLVTIAVHAGYTEYQSRDMVQPAIGNIINTLGYVVSANPIASLMSHITMHIAALFHGPNTTVQLPPHY